MRDDKRFWCITVYERLYHCVILLTETLAVAQCYREMNLVVLQITWQLCDTFLFFCFCFFCFVVLCVRFDYK